MKIFFLLLLSIFLEATKPELILLNTYKNDMNVSSWYMSEKLDGVRAYWDGQELISRGGKIFKAPVFFTKDFPKHKLDGELWTVRGDFSGVVSIVNKKEGHDGWKDIKYNIFEVPNTKGNLLQRLEKVKESKYIQIIKQIKVKNKIHLNKFLKIIEQKGGEGLVVRDGSLEYYTGRNSNALKVKSYREAECEVVAYNEGNGKYKGLVGSLSCKIQNSKVIKIGSGLSEYQRTNPPKISSIITFKYYGLTSRGNPRFPIFLRMK